MGVLVGSAVFPISAVLLWRKASATGAVAGAVVGQAVAIAAWLISAYQVRFDFPYLGSLCERHRSVMKSKSPSFHAYTHIHTHPYTPYTHSTPAASD